MEHGGEGGKLRKRGSLENSKKTITKEATLPVSRCHRGFFLVSSHHLSKKEPKERLGVQATLSYTVIEISLELGPRKTEILS